MRAERSLVQTIGRAARNVEGKVILYAERVTDSMAKALSETDRRRAIQVAYNLEHKITPTTIVKETNNPLLESLRGRGDELQYSGVIGGNPNEPTFKDGFAYGGKRTPQLVRKLEKEMKEAAKNLDFERAASLRDQLKVLQAQTQKSPPDS